MPFLGKYEIPATPPNYLLWYEYVAGRNPALSVAIDRLIDEGARFDDELTGQLRRDYITKPEDRVFFQLQDDVRMLFHELVLAIGQMGGDADKYGQSLTTYAGQIDKDPDVDQLRDLISGLMDETSSIQESRKGMQQKLTRATDDLEELKREFDQIRAESLIDPLTGLTNRKGFDQRIVELMDAHPADGDHLGLLMVDIDFFKKVNDTFGHLVGDEVLRLIANKIEKNVKGSDVVARFGGEEFAILLPRTQYSGALTVADSICERMRKSQLKKRSTGESIGTITLSIGVGRYQPGESVENLIGRADLALYQAKQTGRDRAIGEHQLTPG